ncbi:MAG: flagellar hook-associated protein FlgK [Anaerolineae bacterium]
MPSTFSGLEIALRALRASQRAIEIVDHNTANVNTKGYSRQRAIMAATEPYTVPSLSREEGVGQVGTGVEVAQIHRYSSDYLNIQMRQALPRQNRWQVIEEAMKQIEVVFHEPSDTGIAAALGRFWQAWSDVAAMPENLAARAAVTEAVSSLAFSLRDADSRLRDLQADMDLQIRQTVERMNDIAVEIAALNDPISKVEAFGQQPNDLRDRRDALLNELSQLVDINYYENQDGTITVDIGGHALVMGNEYSQLRVDYDSSNEMLTKVVWKDSSTPLIVHGVPLAGGMDATTGSLVGGQLGGAFYVRDVVVVEQLAELDKVAKSLVESVNSLHATGYGLPDDSTAPPTARPGAELAGLTIDPLGAVSDVLVDGSLYPPDLGIGAGRYTVVTRDNAGVWEFRVLGPDEQAVAINDVGAAGMTSDWQPLATVLGSTYDTGRGFAITFGAAPGVAGEVASFEYRNFFSGSSANDIDISAWIRSQPVNLAAAAGGDAAGDGSIALAIARLRTALVVDGESSIDDYYNSTITSLGLAAKQASAMVANADDLVGHMQRRIDEVSAVSLDEEMVNLIQYQKAYQGAARVMTAVDEMLDRLINGTGRVGL